MAISDIIGSIGGSLVKSLDGLFTSDDERLEAKAKITQILKKGEQDIRNSALAQEKERTERLKLDMASDSWLSKNIRPATLAFLLVVITILAVTDGNLVWDEYEFKINGAYIDLFQNLLMLVAAFYFGSRGFEKVQSGKRTKEVEAEKEKTKRTKNKPEPNDTDIFGEEE